MNLRFFLKSNHNLHSQIVILLSYFTSRFNLEPIHSFYYQTLQTVSLNLSLSSPLPTSFNTQTNEKLPLLLRAHAYRCFN